MRVLHVLDHSPPLQSGYVYRTLAILDGQAGLGWQTAQLTGPKHRVGNDAAESVAGRVYHRTWPPRPASWLPEAGRETMAIRATARRIVEVARTFAPDVLHAHSPALNGAAALLAARTLGLPVVYEIRAFWEDAATDGGTGPSRAVRYRLSRALETWCARGADAVVTISAGLRDDLLRRGVPAAKVAVVPNGVDTARFRADPGRRLEASGPVTLGYVGSLYGYEGLDQLLAVVPSLRALLPQAELLVVGGGPEEAPLRALAHDLGVAGAVRLTGWVAQERVDELYQSIDVCVFPRRASRLTELVTPLKPLEAMAKGKIVVASDVGGHRELIAHGQTGLLVPADDSSALVREIAGLVRQPELVARLRSEARAWVERERAWPRIVGHYAQIYAHAQARRRGHLRS